jgi:LPXTG-site transpeptidase (sortase) family protein
MKRPELLVFHSKEIALSPNGKVIVNPFRMSKVFKRTLACVVFVALAGSVFSYGRYALANLNYYIFALNRMVRPNSESEANNARLASMALISVNSQASPAMLPLSDDAIPERAAAVLNASPKARSSQVVPSTLAAETVIEKAPSYVHELLGQLNFPTLNISVPVVTAQDSSKSVNEGLHNGVVLLAGTDGFGQGGTSIVLGHSSSPLTYRGKYGVIFSTLGKLNVGDQISLEAPGKIYVYTVREKIIVDPKTFNEDLTQNANETLVLVTCWPVGTNKNRIVIMAERTE